MIGTKELAAELGVDPRHVRRVGTNLRLSPAKVSGILIWSEYDAKAIRVELESRRKTKPRGKTKERDNG